MKEKWREMYRMIVMAIKVTKKCQKERKSVKKKERKVSKRSNE
jgi:hypothetical protein